MATSAGGMTALKRMATRETLGRAPLSISRRLAARSGATELIPVTFPPGRARLATSPLAHRIAGVHHDDGDGTGRRLSRLGRGRGRRDEDVHVEASELDGQVGKPVELVFSVAAL